MVKFNKIKQNKVVSKLLVFFQSKLFPIVYAAIVFLSSVLGLEIITFYISAIIFVFIALFCEDTKPLIVIILMVAFSLSVKHCQIQGTAADKDNFLLLQPNVIVQIVVLVCLLVASLVARVIMYKNVKKMFTTRTKLFGGILFMCVALLLNGVDIYSGFGNFAAIGIGVTYDINNLVMGIVEIAALFLCYFIFYFTAVWDKNSAKYLAFVVMVAGLLISAQLFTRATIQLVCGNLFLEGTHSINRGALSLGWGIANNIGGLMVVTIPFAMYLATISNKKSWLYYLFGCVIFAANSITMCRTSLLVSIVVFAVCVVIACVKGANRKANLITTGVLVGVVGIVSLCFINQIMEVFARIVNDGFITNGEGDLADSGRIKIWATAFDNLRKAPIFGVGFYTDVYGSLASGGVFNNMYHNVVVQMIGTCGVVGLLAYYQHSLEVIKVCLKKININRLFIFLGLASIIGVSLFDNNIFYPTVGMFYSVFLAFAEKDLDVTLAENNVLQA